MITLWNDLDRTFSAMDEFRRRFDRLFDEFDGQKPLHATPGHYSFPQIEVKDEGQSLVLMADLPGLTDKDVQISLNQEVLSLSGERKVTVPEGYAAHRRERESFKFARSFALPCKVDVEKATATLKDGVLTLVLPKSAEAQPRPIQIKSALEREDGKMANEKSIEKNRRAEPEIIGQQAVSTPAVDIYENKEEFLLFADLPGVSNNQLSIQLDKGQLTLEGRPEGGSMAYRRVFSLPRGIDETRVEAQMAAGVLRVKLPKAEALKPRRIEVRSA